jgi:hypothetical protein
MGKVIRIYVRNRDPFREAALKLLKDICPRPPPKTKVSSLTERIKHEHPKR